MVRPVSTRELGTAALGILGDLLRHQIGGRPCPASIESDVPGCCPEFAPVCKLLSVKLESPGIFLKFLILFNGIARRLRSISDTPLLELCIFLVRDTGRLLSFIVIPSSDSEVVESELKIKENKVLKKSRVVI